MEDVDMVAQGHLRRQEIAAWLHELADSLVEDGDLVFQHDQRWYGIDLPRRLNFTSDVDVDADSGRTRLGVVLQWRADRWPQRRTAPARRTRS